MTKQTIPSDNIEEILKQVRSINDDAELVRLGKLYEYLTKERDNLRTRLQHSSYPTAFGPALRTDGGADAALLLEGTPLESLTSPQQESDYASLQRQFRAAESALPQIEQKKRELYMTLCFAEVERLRPALQGAYRRVLDSWEGLLFELRRYHDFICALRARGLYANTLTFWQLTPREDGLLHGAPNCPNIETFLRVRREACGIGIDGDNKTRKVR